MNVRKQMADGRKYSTCIFRALQMVLLVDNPSSTIKIAYEIAVLFFSKALSIANLFFKSSTVILTSGVVSLPRFFPPCFFRLRRLTF